MAPPEAQPPHKSSNILSPTIVAVLMPRTLQNVVPSGPWGFAPVSLNWQGTNTLLVIVTAGKCDKKPHTKLAAQTQGQRWWAWSERGGLQKSSHSAGCLKGKMEENWEWPTNGMARAPSFLFCLHPQMPLLTVSHHTAEGSLYWVVTDVRWPFYFDPRCMLRCPGLSLSLFPYLQNGLNNSSPMSWAVWGTGLLNTSEVM